jgi:hypothetical protein
VIAVSGFYMMLIGSIVAAVGQPFLLNTISKVASTWFGDKEVTYY